MDLIVNKLSFAYLAVFNIDNSPGVYNKVKGFTQGVAALGIEARFVCKYPEKSAAKAMAREVASSEEKVLLIRSLCQLNILFLPTIIKARLKGQKVIIDVPTPNRTAIREIWRSKQRISAKLKSLTYLLLAGPVPYWFANLIIQYADESWWFLLFNWKRTVKMGNGIDVDSIPVRNGVPTWPSGFLQLIGVASVNYWHGYQFVIDAIHKFNQSDSHYKVKFTIVGDGAYIPTLREQVDRLKLHSVVSFKGRLVGKDLYSEYEGAHLAVGSLGLHLKGLTEASELKAREYAAIGIPFVATGLDPDFQENTPFRIVIDDNSVVESLCNVFKEFELRYLTFNTAEIRRFASENLDYSIKAKAILNQLATTNKQR